MKGQCLCGAVSISVPQNENVHACHCNMCQRWNGGPLFALHCDEIEIEGSEHITHYQSSEWAERAFCKHCGSHLYYHLLGTQSYEVSSGLFSTQTHFTLEDEIFIDKKPSFYELKNDVPKLTEKEVLEKFGF